MPKVMERCSQMHIPGASAEKKSDHRIRSGKNAVKTHNTSHIRTDFAQAPDTLSLLPDTLKYTTGYAQFLRRIRSCNYRIRSAAAPDTLRLLPIMLERIR